MLSYLTFPSAIFCAFALLVSLSNVSGLSHLVTLVPRDNGSAPETPSPLFPYRLTFRLWDLLAHNINLTDKAGLDALDRLATQATQVSNFTVTSSPVTPPSGDKHDFLSYAPHYWPNDTCATCPWVKKNETNPD